MKKLLAMVMALVILGAVCYAEKDLTIVGIKKMIVTVTDAYVRDAPLAEQGKALYLDIKVSNNADHEQLFQCSKALINDISEVSGIAFVNVGAHAVKTDTLIVLLGEARMSDVSSLTNLKLTMSINVLGDSNYKTLTGSVKADWIKEKVAAHNQQDLGRWQNH